MYLSEKDIIIQKSRNYGYPPEISQFYGKSIWAYNLNFVSPGQDFSKSYSARFLFGGFFDAQECSVYQNLLESKIKAAGFGSLRESNPQFVQIFWIKLRISPWIRKIIMVEKPITK